MENTEIFLKLKEIIPDKNIKQNELMKNHTSFKIGGPADFFVKIDSIEQLNKILNFVKNNNIPLTIIGNGSNLLVLDNGIRGIVIKLDLKNIEISKKENEENKIEVLVDSGVQLGFLAQKLLKEEVSGFEELSGIPGTIGGAVIMNAGAHEKEMKDIISEVTAMDYDGNLYEFSNEECEFGYRNSKFLDGKYIILQAKILLKKGEQQEIKKLMDEYLKYRIDKQPMGELSAGSTFKRGNDYVTAVLIDETGLKGYKIGGAQVSEKHAGFVVNTGDATAQDVIDLIEYVKTKVYEKFQKNLELEIKIIGE